MHIEQVKYQWHSGLKGKTRMTNCCVNETSTMEQRKLEDALSGAHEKNVKNWGNLTMAGIGSMMLTSNNH